VKHTHIPTLLLLSAFLLGQCQQDHSEIVPNIDVSDIVKHRQPTETDFEFIVSIQHPCKLDISVDYSTKDGSAVAGTDYVFTSGTATIPAGSISATVKVKVKGDSLRRDSQFFFLHLDNAKNCTIALEELMATIDNSDGLYFPVDNSGYSTPDSYPNYTLVWRDEFNGKAIDPRNWKFDEGDNGWGYHELVYYSNRSKNAFVSSGNLIIEARKENVHNSGFTSARLTTKDLKSFRFGRIDIRAKIPSGQGIMSSLWMLGNNVGTVGWPACGEIDLMQLPHTENAVYNTVHWSEAGLSKQFGLNRRLENPNDRFHVFSAVWKPDRIEMFVDDVPSFYMNINDTHPFNKDFFFIFNLAVGGDWPGSPDATTQFPKRLVVDYVRVFQ
jgi:hypothetical protein